MKPVRTRIAPSPTGENLHIGNVYAALLNFAVAKKQNGKFIVRIEDTDRTRFVVGSESRILDSLHWLSLNPDESPEIGGPFKPYRQSDIKEEGRYLQYALDLVKNGKAFYCFCTAERLEEMRKKQQEKKEPVLYDGYCKKYSSEEAEAKAKIEKYVIRLNVPDEGVTTFYDLLRGEISFENKLLDDQVLLKSDGFPTYHLGVVIDDHYMQISHIIRAEEWISSTPKHILLYKAFGWELPVFAHIPILRNPDKSKLSKRKNPVWVSWYREEGFLPEAIINYLALMGWGHPEEKEIFSLQEFIEKFDLADIHPGGPIFDLTKLAWMNGEYIRLLSDNELQEKLINFYKDDAELQGFFKKDIAEKLIPLAKTRMKTLKEFRDLVISQKIAFTSEEQKVADLLKEKFTASTDWSAEVILTVMREVLKETKVKGSVLYKVLTGREKGLPLPESLSLLGKEKTLERLT